MEKRYLIYDADCEGSITYKAMRQRMYVVGDYQYTERRYYKVVRDGIIGFNHIPVDGSSKMDDNLMGMLEPFDYNGLQNFEMGYLSGYMAEKFNYSSQDLIEKAKKQRQIDLAKYKATGGLNSWKDPICLISYSSIC